MKTQKKQFFIAVLSVVIGLAGIVVLIFTYREPPKPLNGAYGYMESDDISVLFVEFKSDYTFRLSSNGNVSTGTYIFVESGYSKRYGSNHMVYNLTGYGQVVSYTKLGSQYVAFIESFDGKVLNLIG